MLTGVLLQTGFSTEAEEQEWLCSKCDFMWAPVLLQLTDRLLDLKESQPDL